LNLNNQGLSAVIVPSDYDHSAKLSSDFKLYWKINGSLIEIAIEVKGTGWVYL
jgi:hypothetical protein